VPVEFAPKEYRTLYSLDQLPTPYIGSWSKEYNITYTHIPPCSGGDGYDCWCGNFGQEQAMNSRQAYYGSITFVDDQIGQILQALKQRGLVENTFILFTSDHGDMMNDHFLWRKGYPFEGAAHIPLMIRWPEVMKLPVQRGIKLQSLVELRDIMPTFLDVANVNYTEMNLDGDSLLKLIKTPTSHWREYIDLEHDIVYNASIHWNALTDAKIKYIWWAFSGTEQLFDLAKDPHELVDQVLNLEYLPVLQLWRQRLVDYLSPRGMEWVQNGKLMVRKKSQLYSPNYPSSETIPQQED